MSYSIDFDSAAAREWRKLPINVREQIKPVINALSDDPRPHNSKKLESKDNIYSVRSGDFRVVYSIEDKKLIVQVVAVGDRAKIYKSRK